jgi:hypothetical protein
MEKTILTTRRNHRYLYNACADGEWQFSFRRVSKILKFSNSQTLEYLTQSETTGHKVGLACFILNIYDEFLSESDKIE